MNNSKGKHIPMKSQTLEKPGWGLMERSILLCSVSRQQVGNLGVLEMRPPFINNQVASVVGNKANELSVESICLWLLEKDMLKYWQLRQGTLVTSQIGPGLILDHITWGFASLPLASPAGHVCNECMYLWLHLVHFKTLCWFPWKVLYSSWEHCRMFVWLY